MSASQHSRLPLHSDISPRTETASQKPLSRSLWNNLPHNVTSEEPLQVEKRTNPEGNKWACGC